MMLYRPLTDIIEQSPQRIVPQLRFAYAKVFNSATVTTLMNTYRLTTIEAELAMLICKGVPSNTIARSLGKKVGTVKTQRKSLFLKTRVSRSEQLVSLVFMLAADTDK